MNNAKLKVACIGLGWVTLNRHIPTMENDNLYEIVGVIDHHPGRAKDIASKKGYSFFSENSNLEDIPWLKEVDAIIIGTNPHSHYSLIKSALNLNKHVLTEKPFVLDLKNGEELVKLSHNKNLHLGIVHNFQFASSTKKLIKDIQSGSFGKIKSITATQFSNPKRRLPTWHNQLPYGLFFDESPHFFYLLSCLSPNSLELVSICRIPSSSNNNTPALINIIYSSKNEDNDLIPISVSMNFESAVSEWHITVNGENFVGDIDIFRDIYIKIPNDELHTTSTVFRTSFNAIIQHFMQHFTSGIKHLFKTLRYGNDEVFKRFARAILFNEKLRNINANDALKILKLQFQVVEKLNTSNG